MVRLWEVTTEQAQAMNALEAMQLLGMHNDEASSEAAEWEIAKYVLMWDWGNNPEPPHPPFTYEYHGDLGRDGVRAFKYWERWLPYEQLMNLTVIDAMGLKPEVRAILLTRVNVQPPMPIPAHWPVPIPNFLPAPIPAPIPEDAPEIKIPAGQEDIISMATIPDGTRMVDFHGERAKHRYYTEATYNALNPKKNPYTRQTIEPNQVTRYIAKLDSTLPVQEAGRRRKTRKYKRRAKKTRRNN